jgi:hypothetical protein
VPHVSTIDFCDCFGYRLQWKQEILISTSRIATVCWFVAQTHQNSTVEIIQTLFFIFTAEMDGEMEYVYRISVYVAKMLCSITNSLFFGLRKIIIKK